MSKWKRKSMIIFIQIQGDFNYVVQQSEIVYSCLSTLFSSLFIMTACHVNYIQDTDIPIQNEYFAIVSLWNVFNITKKQIAY